MNIALEVFGKWVFVEALCMSEIRESHASRELN